MMPAALLLSLLAAHASGAAETTLSYTVGRGADAKSHLITFAGATPRGKVRMGFEGFPSPVQNLPLWLPYGSRKLGTVVYDDGEGFKHDKGREVYVLRFQDKWKKFTGVGLSYRYQGMQPMDNWMIRAIYDKSSGFLLWAEVSTMLDGRDPHVTFELTLSAASVPALNTLLN